MFRVTTSDNRDNTIFLQGAISKDKNKDIASVIFQNYDLDDLTLYNMAAVAMRDNYGDSLMNGAGNLIFKTNLDGKKTSLQDRFCISYDGNVGIGTTTPMAKLDVHGTIRSSELTPNRLLYAQCNLGLSSSTITYSEVEYLNGVTHNIQAQLDEKIGSIDGAASTVIASNLHPLRVIQSDTQGKLSTSHLTYDELQYLKGLTFNVQTQLDGKLSVENGAISRVAKSNMVPFKAIVTDVSGKIIESQVNANELNCMSGVTSFIQNQIDSKVNAVIGAVTSIAKSNLPSEKVLISDGLGKVNAAELNSYELVYIQGLTSPLQMHLDSKVNIAQANGAISTVSNNNLQPLQAVVTTNEGKITTAPVTPFEISCLSGVLSPIQQQINTKLKISPSGAIANLTQSNLAPSRVLISNSLGKIINSATAINHLEYLSDVTSPVQDQIDSKQALITGSASSITVSNLTPSKVLVTDEAGKIKASTIGLTEINYMNGVTSNIQTQINSLSAVSGINMNINNNNGLTYSNGVLSVSVVTQALNGVMSAVDKHRLDTIGTSLGAYVGGSTGQVQFNNGSNIFGSATYLTIGTDQLPRLEAFSNASDAPVIGVNLMSETKTLQDIPAFQDIDGYIFELQASLVSGNVFYVGVKGNLVSYNIFNIQISALGTAASRSTNTPPYNRLSTSRRIAQISDISLNSRAGINTTSTNFHFRRGNGAGVGGFYFVFRYAIGGTVTTQQRTFVGLSQLSIEVAGNISATTNMVGFGADSGDASTTFMHCDAVSPANKVPLQGNFPARNTLASEPVFYEARIFSSPNDTSICYSLENLMDGSYAEGSVNTKLPATTIAIRPYLVTNNGNSGKQVHMEIVSIYGEQRF